MIDCNEWKTEKHHEWTNKGKKRLELWWQLYRTWLPERDVQNITPMDFVWLSVPYGSQDRSVDIVARLRAGLFDSRHGQEIFLSSKTLKVLWLTQPPVATRGGFSPGVKRPRLQVDNVYPSGAEVKNEWNYTSPPPIYLHRVVRNGFIFHMYHKTRIML